MKPPEMATPDLGAVAVLGHLTQGTEAADGSKAAHQLTDVESPGFSSGLRVLTGRSRGTGAESQCQRDVMRDSHGNHCRL